MDKTIVEYFAEHEGYRCGYCKSPNTNFSHGMWAHTCTPEVYQGLIDRGWRRSGHYVYKPTNNITCCPMYTIRCNALEFKISKSQKKVLKKMNDKSAAPKGNEGKIEQQQIDRLEKGEHLKMEVSEIEKPEITLSSVSESDKCIPTTSGTVELEKPEEIPKKESENGCSKKKSLKMDTTARIHDKVGSDTDKIKPLQKRREFRLQKRKEKLEKQGKPTELLNLNKEKGLTDLILENDLQVELVSVESKEFEKYFNELHSLYKKYQMKIHEDTEEECAEKQFRRFLCDSPLVKNGPYGSHHQLYRKSGKLIAVGVIDILPSCVSSVYFFYDPDFTYLSLGTYGALHEIYFVQQLNAMFNNVKYYYMGFYIHSCQKMRYKGNYTPSYLLCPEIYQWRILDDKLKEELNERKYMKLGVGEPVPQTVDDVMILKSRRILSYKEYNAKRDREEIAQYCTLVGSEMARKILLYRK